MVYAEFGGQTECIMGNWKIENTVYPTHFICCIVALFIGSTWSIEERRLLVSAERCDGM